MLLQAALEKLMSDAVAGGMISSDPQRMTANTVVCGFKIALLCSISNVQ